MAKSYRICVVLDISSVLHFIEKLSEKVFYITTGVSDCLYAITDARFFFAAMEYIRRFPI